MAVKKKKARKAEIQRLMSPTEQKKYQRKVDKLMDDADEESRERGEWADSIISAQDQKTRRAFEAMVESLIYVSTANGTPTAKIHVEGWPGSVVVPQPRSMYENNLKYMAVKMIIAAAEMDIRMENFTMPRPKKKRRVTHDS